MARTSRPESVYTIRIHKNGGYMYACTNMYRLNDDGKRVYKIIHWGRLTPDNEFLPGKHYMNTPVSERMKLIFPTDWNLSRIRELI